MSSSDLFILFGPLLAFSTGLAIMYGVWYYGIEKGYWQ
jgi:hypothetical protein